MQVIVICVHLLCEKMSSENQKVKKSKHAQCIKCGSVLWKTPGQTKTIKTQGEAHALSVIINKTVEIRDQLCNKCRKIMYEKPAKDVSTCSIEISSHSEPMPSCSTAISSGCSAPTSSLVALS